MIDHDNDHPGGADTLLFAMQVASDEWNELHRVCVLDSGTETSRKELEFLWLRCPDVFEEFTTAGSSALHLCVVSDNEHLIRPLIDKMPVLVNFRNYYGETALHWACGVGKLNVARILLANGAQCDVEDNEGNRPLDWALSENHKDVVRFLEDFGAKANPNRNNLVPSRTTQDFRKEMSLDVPAENGCSSGTIAHRILARLSPRRRRRNGKS